MRKNLTNLKNETSKYKKLIVEKMEQHQNKLFLEQRKHEYNFLKSSQQKLVHNIIYSFQI